MESTSISLSVKDALNGHVQMTILQKSHLPRSINLPQVTSALIRGEEGGHRRTIQVVGLMYSAAPPTTNLRRLTRPTMVSQSLVVQIFMP